MTVLSKRTLDRVVRAVIRGGLGAGAIALSTGAALAAEGEDSSALEEVVVSAQYREESLQETPIAITAMTAEMLEARGLTNIAEVGATAPNVTLRVANAAFGKSTQAFIRGVGQGDMNFAYEPGVGMYIDDVYHSTVFGSVFDLLDLERVEGLRGPQGTLFGKNSIGGAVRMISRKPQGDGSGYFDLTYGSYDRVDFRGGMDVALTDNLFARVSGVSKHRQGYMDQIDFVCAHPDLAGSLQSQMRQLDGGCKLGTFGGEDVQGGRIALRYLPTDQLEINLTADYLDDNSELQANKLIYVDPTAPSVVRWNQNVNIPNFGIPFDERFLTDSPYTTYATLSDPVRRTSVPNRSGVESWGTSLKLDYKLSDSLSITSITAYRSYQGEFSYDQDGSPFAMQTPMSLLDHSQFSQELRATGVALGDRLDYTVGAFYFDGDSYYGGHIQQNLAGLDFYQNDHYDTENKSVFVHTAYHVTPQLNAIVGLRYTDESKVMHFDHPPFLSIPTPSEAAYSRTDWRVGLDYNLTDTVMMYGQVATGFRSGGFNPRPFSAAQLVSFGPEELTSYELGAKTEFFQRALRLNLALFYSDYQDRIRNEQSVDADGLPFSRPMNVGEASVKGVELEIEARPTDGLLLTASYGFAEVDYDELEGRQNPGLPEHTASASAQYEIVLPKGQLTPRLDWTYQSEVYYDIRNTPIAREGGTSLLNARLGWESTDGNWSLALAVTNLTDKEYYINRFPKLDLGQGTVEGQPGRPREWSISVKRRF